MRSKTLLGCRGAEARLKEAVKDLGRIWRRIRYLEVKIRTISDYNGSTGQWRGERARAVEERALHGTMLAWWSVLPISWESWLSARRDHRRLSERAAARVLVLGHAETRLPRWRS